MRRHWVRLQLRFEASNVIASGDIKWQYIATIATFSSLFCCNRGCMSPLKLQGAPQIVSGIGTANLFVVSYVKSIDTKSGRTKVRLNCVDTA